MSGVVNCGKETKWTCLWYSVTVTDDSSSWECTCKETDLKRCDGIWKLVGWRIDVTCNMTLKFCTGPLS
eukprot:UN22847